MVALKQTLVLAIASIAGAHAQDVSDSVSVSPLGADASKLPGD
jgi:hypothetical protein